jgi:hypothetical protein
MGCQTLGSGVWGLGSGLGNPELMASCAGKFIRQPIDDARFGVGCVRAASEELNPGSINRFDTS